MKARTWVVLVIALVTVGAAAAPSAAAVKPGLWYGYTTSGTGGVQRAMSFRVAPNGARVTNWMSPAQLRCSGKGNARREETNIEASPPAKAVIRGSTLSGHVHFEHPQVPGKWYDTRATGHFSGDRVTGSWSQVFHEPPGGWFSGFCRAKVTFVAFHTDSPYPPPFMIGHYAGGDPDGNALLATVTADEVRDVTLDFVMTCDDGNKLTRHLTFPTLELGETRISPNYEYYTLDASLSGSGLLIDVEGEATETGGGMRGPLCQGRTTYIAKRVGGL